MSQEKYLKDSIKNDKKQENKRQKVLLLAGVSGVGKSTIIKKLVNEHNFYFGVSHTTRGIRVGEINGKDYHFISKEEFAKLKDQDAFIETMSFANNEYGMTFAEIENTNRDVVLDLDYNGYKFVKSRYPHLVGIFLMHTDLDELKRRLEQRERDNDNGKSLNNSISSKKDKHENQDSAKNNLNTQSRLDAMEDTMKEAKFFDYIIDVTNETPDSILQKVLEKL